MSDVEYSLPPDRPCAECGGVDIVKGVVVRNSGDRYTVGLAYGGLVFGSTEPLLADLCNTCGTVLRFRVASGQTNWRLEN